MVFLMIVSVLYIVLFAISSVYHKFMLILDSKWQILWYKS